MRTITVEGSSLDEALAKASLQLNIPKDQLVYSIKPTPKSMFSVFMKPKVVLEIQARPRYTSARDVIYNYLSDLLTNMDIAFTIDIREDEPGSFYVHIRSEDGGALIGKSGQTLEALTHICKQYLTYTANSKAKLFININDYQEKKEKILADLVKKAVADVTSSGKPFTFEAMESHDRKFIHQQAQNYSNVVSKSEGKNNKRWVVIYPKNGV